MLGHDDSDPIVPGGEGGQGSVLEPFLGKSRYRNHGQRVVEGQRLMQSASDIMLGWLRSDGSMAFPETSTSANSGTARDRQL
jgi:hypothetical protein